MRIDLLLCLLAATVLSSTASAQLDLPGNKTGSAGGGGGRGKPSGNLVPHLVCSACYERNYNTAIDPQSPDGLQMAPCSACRRNTFHRQWTRGRQGDLRLPTMPPRPSEAPNDRGPDPAALDTEPVFARGVPVPSDGSRAAAFIFSEVARLRIIDDSLASKAVESLSLLGEEGRAVARLHLASDHGPTVMTAARVLLRSAKPEDLDLIVDRLRSRVPPSAGGPLLEELAQRDPVRANPRLMIELLDHPQSGVRTSAARHLKGAVDGQHLPSLIGCLSSKRSETRLRAVHLIDSVNDPAVLDILLDHMADPKARVARAAVDAVARLDDPRVEVELVARAFSNRWILRANAYALLAVLTREEDEVKGILSADHVPALLQGMSSSDPFISGTCAASLAGIGFRSARPKDTEWLDREVMDRLIYSVSGREFHNDYSSLSIPVTIRLEQLTGQAFGHDGPRWVEWWLEKRESFFANRAYIEVAEQEEQSLTVRYRTSGTGARAFTLMGPAAAQASQGLQLQIGERLYLTEGECKGFVDLARREGMFGPECLPGFRGPRGGGERTLEILVGNQGKAFTFAESMSEPWFEKAASAASSLADRNRWQRYPTPGVHASSFDLWKEQAAWWSNQQDQRARGRRMIELVFASLREREVPQREGGVLELERLYADRSLVQLTDFGRFVDLLRGEVFLGRQAQILIDLALNAAGYRSDGTGAVEDELGIDLVGMVAGAFGETGAESLAGIMVRCGGTFTREMLTAERPLVRAVAATVVGSGTVEPSERDALLLKELLTDLEPRVEAAGVLALGRLGTEDARSELMLRARMGRSPVREAALQAIGLMGGEFVLDALMVGLSDSDLMIKQAAVMGLSELGDPVSAPLLVSMLGQGRDSPVFEPAKEGLLKLGSEAWSDLLRVAHSSSHRSQREAALLLAYQSVPEVTSTLMSLLTKDGEDALVAEELVVLTCIDYRDEAEPVLSWWDWWDSVVHDDAMAWFRAALERRGISAPPTEAFEASNPREAARFLMALMRDLVQRDDAPLLLERSRRELSRLLGKDLGRLPEVAAERQEWLATLEETIKLRWKEE